MYSGILPMPATAGRRSDAAVPYFEWARTVAPAAASGQVPTL